MTFFCDACPASALRSGAEPEAWDVGNIGFSGFFHEEVFGNMDNGTNIFLYIDSHLQILNRFHLPVSQCAYIGSSGPFVLPSRRKSEVSHEGKKH